MPVATTAAVPDHAPHHKQSPLGPIGTRQLRGGAGLPADGTALILGVRQTQGRIAGVDVQKIPRPMAADCAAKMHFAFEHRPRTIDVPSIGSPNLRKPRHEARRS